MKPARTSSRQFDKTKLMVVGPDGQITHSKVAQLANFLQPYDLLVVNRSGSMPSSFAGRLTRTGDFVELRLAAFRGQTASDYSRWAAVAFGGGTWRMTTESRPLPPPLKIGDQIEISPNLVAVIRKMDFPRLIEIEFLAQNLVQALFTHGRPIQYSYLEEELEVWDHQTAFSGPPISVEPPSAAFPLNWMRLFQLKAAGIRIAAILHGAGISSTGDPELDQQLPLAEYYEVPRQTVDAISAAHSRGGRVIALGTTVTRALESAALSGELRARQGYTSLKLHAQFQLRVVNGLLTGMHETNTSHAQLMQAFCAGSVVERANAEADRLLYRSHEFGDMTLLG